MIQIFVKGIDGKTSTHQFPGITAKVDELFDTLAKQISIDRNELRILYGTHQLECGKGKTFEDYGMGNMATCFIVLRLRGGHNPLQMLRSKKQSLQPLPGYITLTLEACMITLDDDANMNRAKMPCGHVISPMAMSQYGRSLLDENRSTFPCPYVGKDGDRCSATWQFFLVKHVAALSQEELTEFETKLSENFARRSMGVQQCPGCQSFCMKVNKGDIIVRCPVCTKRLTRNYHFCWCCLHPSSSQTQCQNPKCDKRDPRMRYLEECPRKEIVGVPACPTLRACVKCGILIEHTEACKHMTCTGCKASFCFICLKEPSNNKWQCGNYNSKCTPAPVQTAIQGN